MKGQVSMKIIKKQTKITEAPDKRLAKSLFGISKEKLEHRKISVDRVLDDARKALEKATKDSNTEIASLIQDKVMLLQDLLDSADEIVPTTKDPNSEAEAGEEGKDSKEDKEDSVKDADSTKDDAKTDIDSDETGETKKDKDSKSGEEDSAEGSEENAYEGSDSEGKGRTDSKGSDTDDTGSEDSGSSEKDDTKDEESDTKDKKTSSTGGSKSDADSEDSSDSKDGLEDDGDSVGSPAESGTGKGRISGGSGEAGDKKILIDPFADAPGTPVSTDIGSDALDVETPFEAAKRILSELTGEARRGAIEGLKDLLSGRGADESFIVKNSLKEALSKTLGQLSDEELDDILSETQGLVDQVLDIKYSDDLGDRVKAIQKDLGDRVSAYELEKEDSQYLKDDPVIKAREAEKEKYKSLAPLKGLEAFEATLYSCINDQVDMVDDNEKSWSALDRRHEDDPTIFNKGVKHIEFEEESYPILNVYFDQSGSWSDYEVKIGQKAIATLAQFEEDGKLHLNPFYISAAGVCDTAAAARREGGAEGWHACLQHIVSSGANNVVILSDSDLDSFEWSNRPTGNNGRVVVDGCVWWLWKNNRRSKKAVQELVGRQGNFEFQFSTYDD